MSSLVVTRAGSPAPPLRVATTTVVIDCGGSTLDPAVVVPALIAVADSEEGGIIGVDYNGVRYPEKRRNEARDASSDGGVFENQFSVLWCVPGSGGRGSYTLNLKVFFSRLVLQITGARYVGHIQAVATALTAVLEAAAGVPAGSFAPRPGGTRVVMVNCPARFPWGVDRAALHRALSARGIRSVYNSNSTYSGARLEFSSNRLLREDPDRAGCCLCTSRRTCTNSTECGKVTIGIFQPRRGERESRAVMTSHSIERMFDAYEWLWEFLRTTPAVQWRAASGRRSILAAARRAMARWRDASGTP